MPDAPWRCSQCGTVNEPAANACRTCGRWPSLFDLEASTVDQEPRPRESVEQVDVYAPEPAPMDVPVFDPEPTEIPSAELPPEFAPEQEGAEGQTGGRPGWQRFARFVVPVGVALYLIISALANRGG